ncbi:hypothetical protein ZIOFF_045241 [Zingiber officinale]|uniref:Acireductone dioxygenase n=1 Tax=Zingiber officinale TaxID=94328 RepID=A0A8J5GCW4_ZINOF|nr:hypothetical protein ZIOFF_045241 [Zingiber officinale]
METAFQDGKEEVLQAWYMDDSEEDQRLPHHREPKEFVSLDKLAELGIVSWRLNPVDYENDADLKKIREARGYSYVDICDVCPEKLPNYEAKLKDFFEEHLHTDEEIRYCLEGSGYFDARDKNDRWIRIAVKQGGMIVLPAGIYHRFTLDSDNYIKRILAGILVVIDMLGNWLVEMTLHIICSLCHLYNFSCRQCASLWASQFGLPTIAPMIISLQGKHMWKLLLGINRSKLIEDNSGIIAK